MYFIFEKKKEKLKKKTTKKKETKKKRQTEKNKKRKRIKTGAEFPDIIFQTFLTF